VRSNRNPPKDASFVGEVAGFVPPMLLPPAQDLYLTGEQSAFADIDLSQNAVGANADAVPKRCTRVSEERSERDVTVPANAGQSKSVVGGSQVSAGNARHQGHRVSEKQVRFMPPPKAREAGRRKDDDSRYGSETSLLFTDGAP
jgi:hypothetical protein